MAIRLVAFMVFLLFFFLWLDRRCENVAEKLLRLMTHLKAMEITIGTENHPFLDDICTERHTRIKTSAKPICFSYFNGRNLHCGRYGLQKSI